MQLCCCCCCRRTIFHPMQLFLHVTIGKHAVFVTHSYIFTSLVVPCRFALALAKKICIHMGLCKVNSTDLFFARNVTANKLNQIKCKHWKYWIETTKKCFVETESNNSYILKISCMLELSSKIECSSSGISRKEVCCCWTWTHFKCPIGGYRSKLLRVTVFNFCKFLWSLRFSTKSKF